MYHVIIAISFLVAMVLASAATVTIMRRKQKEERPVTYSVKIICGTRIHRVTIGQEQYEQLQVWINGTDGYFLLESDRQTLVLYREHTASVTITKVR